MYGFDKDIHLAGATVQEQKKCIQEKDHKLWVVAFCDTLHLEYTHAGASVYAQQTHHDNWFHGMQVIPRLVTDACTGLVLVQV